jgi:hypothetical protein
LVVALVMALASVSGLSRPLDARADSASEGQFVPFASGGTVLDTRLGLGAGGKVAPVPANGSITIQLFGQDLPPSEVSAVALNVVVVSPAKTGWLSIYPSDVPTDISSITYSPLHSNVSGMDITRVTSTGKVTLYNHSDGPVDLEVAERGYFLNATATSGGDEYKPVPTALIYDTRHGIGTGQPTTPIPTNGEVTVDVAGVAGIPASGVSAVVLNIVAVDSPGTGRIALRPSDQTRGTPKGPALDYAAGEADSNAEIEKLSSTGKLTLTNYGRAVDVSISVRGYFTASTGSTPSSSFEPTDPTIILQTLDGTGVDDGSTRPLAAGASISFDATSASGAPSTAVTAAALDIEAEQPTAKGWLSVYPYGSHDPAISSVNFGVAGKTTDGFDTVIPGTEGHVTITNHSTGTVHVRVVARGYYLKATADPALFE